jgi:KDO2-lipid IV(A) lauroyltransferase
MMLILWSVPLPLVYRVADCLGWFTFHVLRIRRDVSLENLARAFPEKPEGERRKIAQRAYRNVAKMACEFVRFPVMKKEDVLSQCRYVGWEMLEAARRMNRGAILVSGHFGNWELLGASIAQMGYPVAFVVKPQHNRLVDEMINRNRNSMGARVIPLGLGIRGVLKALKQKQFVALLADQDAGPLGKFVDFLGRPSSTHQGVAAFVLKTGAPLVFGVSVREPRGVHRIHVHMLTFDHLNGITDENIQEVTQAHASLLESYIRKYPDHWFWMHKRWKTQQPQAGRV